MSEDGCLRDAVFNTFQVVSGSVEDSFPGGKGAMKGLTVKSQYNISMGNNRVEDIEDNEKVQTIHKCSYFMFKNTIFLSLIHI